MSTVIDYTIKGFKGVNIRSPKYFIEETDLAVCKNFDLGVAGELIKRPGWDCPHNGSSIGAQVNMLGIYYTDVLHQLIAATSAKTFYSADGTTWTELKVGGVSFAAKAAIQYNNKMYLLRSGTIVEWDGAAATAIASSPNAEGGVMLRDRMFTFNTFGTGVTGSRITFSMPGNVNTAGGWTGGGSFDVNPGDGDVICALAILQDNLIIFKMNSVWSLSLFPDPADWTLRVLNDEIGCFTKYGVKVIDNYLYFISARAVYKTDGSTFQDISVPINTVLRDRIVSRNTIHTDAIAWWQERLLIVLATTNQEPIWATWTTGTWDALKNLQWNGSATRKTYWSFNLKANGWTQYEMDAAINPFTFVETRYETPVRGLWAGDASTVGKIFRLTTDRYQDSDGTNLLNYICEMETMTFDFGHMTMMGRIFNEPSHMKRIKWVGLRRYGTDGNVYLRHIVDESTRADIPSAPLNGSGMSKLRGPGYGEVFRWNVQFDSSSYVEFHALVAHLHRKRTAIANTG